MDANEIDAIKRDPRGSEWMPKQEPGTRVACPLKYELYADAKLEGDALKFALAAERRVFGKEALSSAFNVYAYTGKDVLCRNYAVTAGTRLEDHFALGRFDDGVYRLRIDGPNGFYREFRGRRYDPKFFTQVEYKRYGSHLTGNLELTIRNESGGTLEFAVTDNGYGGTYRTRAIETGASAVFDIDGSHSHGWYDVSISLPRSPGIVKRYAGHVETGKWSITDPAMA